jgi:hypothetical protein
MLAAWLGMLYWAAPTGGLSVGQLHSPRLLMALLSLLLKLVRGLALLSAPAVHHPQMCNLWKGLFEG